MVILSLAQENKLIKNIYEKISPKAFIKQYPTIFIPKQMPITIFGYKIKNNIANEQPKEICYWEQLQTDVLERIYFFVIYNKIFPFKTITQKRLASVIKQYQTIMLVNKQATKLLHLKKIILYLQEGNVLPPLYLEERFKDYYTTNNIAKYLMICLLLKPESTYLNTCLENAKPPFVELIEIFKKQIGICKHLFDNKIKFNEFLMTMIPLNNYSIEEDIIQYENEHLETPLNPEKAIPPLCLQLFFRILKKSDFTKYCYFKKNMLLTSIIHLKKKYDNKLYYFIVDPLTECILYTKSIYKVADVPCLILIFNKTLIFDKDINIPVHSTYTYCFIIDYIKKYQNQPISPMQDITPNVHSMTKNSNKNKQNVKVTDYYILVTPTIKLKRYMGGQIQKNLPNIITDNNQISNKIIIDFIQKNSAAYDLKQYTRPFQLVIQN